MNFWATTGDPSRLPAQAVMVPLVPDDTGLGSVYELVVKILKPELLRDLPAMTDLNPGDIVRVDLQQQAAFRTVLFMLDDPERAFDEMLGLAMRAAGEQRIATLSLPVWREGETIPGQVARASKSFMQARPEAVRRVIFVAFNRRLASQINRALMAA